MAMDFSRSLSKVLAKCLSIQKFNLGKVCLKVVVKVALSLQRLASARQVKIFNHTIIVRSQLIATEEATQYARRTNSWRGRKRGHPSLSICWRDRSTRLVFYLFSWFSILSAFVNASIFVKKSSFPSSLFRRKLSWIRSVSALTSCFWKCLFCRCCTIKISVLNVNYQKLKKDRRGIFS